MRVTELAIAGIRLVAVFSIVSVASAGPVTLDATNRGWVPSSAAGIGNGSASSNSYYAGLSSSVELRNWFVFSLAGVASPITSGSLLLDVATANSDSLFETFQITSTSTSVATLIAGTVGSGAYSTLGTGTFFSSINIAPSQSNTTISMTLNAAGIAAVNANLLGQIAFSGRVTTLSVPSTDGVFLGSGSSLYKTRLHLTDSPVVPLPGGAAMAMVGMGVIGVRRRRS